jgi:hypothetical protein
MDKMKIVIAKSLLEPVSISWPEPYGKIAGWIRDEVEAMFQLMEKAGLLPSAGGQCYSVDEVRAHFKGLVERRGAVDVKVGCANLSRNATWVGYIFLVHFREPGKKKQHVVAHKTLFLNWKGHELS